MYHDKVQFSPQDAREIIATYKTSFKDFSSTEPLKAEMPSFANRICLSGNFSLFRSEDNEAGTFKWRGALLGALALREAGHDTIAVPSAGNHARGAILAGRVLNMAVNVIVPKSAPPAKKEKLKDLWKDGCVQIYDRGLTFDEALEWTLDQQGQLGGLLHPYDDRNVMLGQGTMFADIMSNAPETERIVVAAGGLGMYSGMLLHRDDLGMQEVNVLAALAIGSDSWQRSLDTGTLSKATSPNQRYGGSAVQQIGRQCYKTALQSNNRSFVTVDDEHVESVMEMYNQDRHDLLRLDTPSIEPTSIVAVAALGMLNKNVKTVAVASGTNAELFPLAITRPHTIRAASGMHIRR